MKIPNYFLLFLLSCTFLATTSCNKEKDPVITNEEEVITTLRYSLTPLNGSETLVLSFEDLDGDGGNEPVIEGGTLSANTSYTGELILLNEAADPVESITAEILEEAEDHQFFFSSTGLDIDIVYLDEDANNQPLGLSSTLTTKEVGTGNLTITLRHEPNKSAAGVAEGDFVNAGGETDIEVTFPIEVQ